MTDISVFLPNLAPGGAERVMLNLAGYFRARSLTVELVVAQAAGPLLDEVPSGVRVIDLHSPRVIGSLGGLAGYLRRSRPRALLSALDHANLVAIWAGALSRVGTRVVASVHVVQGQARERSRLGRDRWVRWMARLFYPAADAVVAVSRGVADDLVEGLGLPRAKIRVIFNPAVTPGLAEKAAFDPGHPWLAKGSPPVILGAGRLTAQKDFPTLIRAFDRVRQARRARLMILGEGEERGRLEGMIESLQMGDAAALPGFTPNPYAWMSRASVFALSSAWEGFGVVLVESMACGTPVVSTDCVAGPAEILEDGKYGRLVPVGDERALAEAILATLENPPQASLLRRRAADFSVERIGEQYLEVLGLR